MDVQRRAVVVNVCCYFELATHKREGDTGREAETNRRTEIDRERETGRERDRQCKRLSKQDSARSPGSCSC